MPSNKTGLHKISRTQTSSVDNKIYDVGYMLPLNKIIRLGHKFQ